jgi:hypothetical protein
VKESVFRHRVPLARVYSFQTDTGEAHDVVFRIPSAKKQVRLSCETNEQARRLAESLSGTRLRARLYKVDAVEIEEDQGDSGTPESEGWE